MTTMNIATTIVIVVAAFSASRMQSSSISGTSSLQRCVMVAACEASRGCVFVALLLIAILVLITVMTMTIMMMNLCMSTYIISICRALGPPEGCGPSAYARFFRHARHSSPSGLKVLRDLHVDLPSWALSNLEMSHVSLCTFLHTQVYGLVRRHLRVLVFPEDELSSFNCGLALLLRHSLVDLYRPGSMCGSCNVCCSPQFGRLRSSRLHAILLFFLISAGWIPVVWEPPCPARTRLWPALPKTHKGLQRSESKTLMPSQRGQNPKP